MIEFIDCDNKVNTLTVERDKKSISIEAHESTGGLMRPNESVLVTISMIDAIELAEYILDTYAE